MMKHSTTKSFLVALAPLSLALLAFGCSEQPQDSSAQAPENRSTTTPQASVSKPPAASASVERGMFFKPDLKDFALHNESDEDGDGDGIKETHVRRYINKAGDSAFSMTTNERLWAWSLNRQGGDDTDIHRNFVVRDSNCDGVFDERYSLDAEFHVPGCLAQEAAAAQQ